MAGSFKLSDAADRAELSPRERRMRDALVGARKQKESLLALTQSLAEDEGGVIAPDAATAKRHSPPTEIDEVAGVYALLGLRGAQLAALLLLLQRIAPTQICALLGIGEDTLLSWRKMPAFAHQLKKALFAMREQIERGDFGVVPMAKANAERMMHTLITKAKSAKNEETSRRAAESVLALAGHTPIKKIESVNVNKIVDQMTPEEMGAFIDRGEFPVRFRDQLSILQAPGGVSAVNTKRRTEAIDVVSSEEDEGVK